MLKKSNVLVMGGQGSDNILFFTRHTKTFIDRMDNFFVKMIFKEIQKT